MKSFVVSALAAIASAKVLSQNDFDFVNFIATHGKSYNSLDEYNLRFERFTATQQAINLFNATEQSSTHGHNFLSDLTAEEKTKILGLKNMALPERKPNTPIFTANGLEALPASVNWCTAGKCNAVKDQQQCGSCWAFASIAVLESAHAIFKGTLYSLSEQQLVSCSSSYGNQGCNGGWYYYAWDYAVTYSVESGSAYPYTSGTGVTGTCKYVSSQGLVNSISQTDVGTDTTSIKTAIAQQPVAVAIEADTSYFQSYTSGVLTNAAACGSNIDHAVTAVGYGTDATYGGYYIVRNSWGTGWGSKGYVNIGQANNPGICGIN